MSSHQLLNLEELSSYHEVSDNNREKLFSDVLNSCHNKIKKYNKEFKRRECLYAPPVFIIGRPPYNYIDLINYVIDSLKSNGLKAEWLAHKKSIYISWKPADLDIAQYHSHFSDTVYDEDTHDNSFKVMSVRSSPPQTQTRKKKDVMPKFQHVAMINYGSNTRDLVPVNIKGFKTENGGLRP